MDSEKNTAFQIAEISQRESDFTQPNKRKPVTRESTAQWNDETPDTSFEVPTGYKTGEGELSPELGNQQNHMESEDTMLTVDMLLVEKFKELLKQDLDFSEEEKQALFQLPEVRELLEGSIERIIAHFSTSTVLAEMENLYSVLSLHRSNEQALQELLRSKNEEIVRLNERRDPRLMKALHLAESWRKEKFEQQKATQDCEAKMNQIIEELDKMHSKVRNQQNLTTKIIESRAQIGYLEDQIRILDDELLLKENAIINLQSELNELNLFADQEANEAIQQINELRATTVPKQCIEDLEAERRKVRDRQSLIMEHKQLIEALEIKLEKAKKAEEKSYNQNKQIAASIKSLKNETRKIHNHMIESDNRMAQLMILQEKNEKKITLLEDQIRRHVANEDKLRQALQLVNHKNETLKRQLSTLAIIEKKYAQHHVVLRRLHAQRKETKACRKYGNNLEHEIKKTKLCLRETQQRKEAQQISMNKANEVALTAKHILDDAIRYNDILTKRQEVTDRLLSYCLKKLDCCKDDKMDLLSTMEHLNNVTKDHVKTIRIKDNKNDCLVLELSKLKSVLNASNLYIQTLRQKNGTMEGNYKRQVEMNDILNQILLFAEVEKRDAVSQSDKHLRTVVILKNQQVIKLNKIVWQYREILELKSTINKHLQTLRAQKVEMLTMRRLIESAQQVEASLKCKISALESEKNIMAALAIRKTTESQLLEKKIDILGKVINRGSSDHSHRLKDIQFLKLEIKNLRRALISKNSTADMNNELRMELVKACHQLTLEQNKCRAMEEMKLPEYHRHNNLKGREETKHEMAISQDQMEKHAQFYKFRDPSEFEKVLKIQKLQKLLIVKVDKINNMENMILEKDGYLRQIYFLMSRRSGKDLAQQFHDAKTTIAKKNREIKGLLSEMNFLTFDRDEYKKKLEEVTGELKIAKEKNANQKRQAIKASSAVVHKPLLLNDEVMPFRNITCQPKQKIISKSEQKH